MTSHIVHDLIYLSYSIWEEYEDVSNCEHVYYHFVQMMLDGEMTKFKVVDLDDFCNFIVCDFFSWNHLLSKKFIRSSHILKFKFWIVRTKSHGKMSKIKVVDLDDLYNFVGSDFSIWNHFLSQNSFWGCNILKLQKLSQKIQNLFWATFSSLRCPLPTLGPAVHLARWLLNMAGSKQSTHAACCKGPAPSQF